MTMIFSQSAAYRNLPFKQIASLSENQALDMIKRIRWGEGDEFECPECTEMGNHPFLRSRNQWTCKHCKYRFSVTSYTPFSHRKLSLVDILSMVHQFAVSAQGIASNSFHPSFGTTCKTAWHNFGKVREVLHQTRDLRPLQGVVHIDCAHFCGKPRKANQRKKTDSYATNNHLKNRKAGISPDKRNFPEYWNMKKLKNRRIILVMSQLDLSTPDAKGADRTIAFVIKVENAASILPLINKYVSKNAVIMTDMGSAFHPIYAELGISHSMVNHSKEYMDKNGINNNMAESFFSRVRRAEYGTYNGMRKQYFAFYSSEFVWRNDTRNMTVREKFENLLSKIFSCETSKAFCNYNHKHRLGFEYLS